MNTLRKTGTILAASGAFLLAGCSAEQASPVYSEAGPITDLPSGSTSTLETPSAPTIAPEISSDTSQPAAAERQQKMHALLKQACGYVIEQDAHVKEDFPDVWTPNSPMYTYADEYDALTGGASISANDNGTFHFDLKRSCPQYGEIYSKNDG